MGVKKIYETNRGQAYAKNEGGQVVSRSLYAVVERGDTPLDSGFGEETLIEIEPETGAPVHLRIDTVPQDTIATSPDAAARAASVIQSLNDGNGNQLGFRVEYPAD